MIVDWYLEKRAVVLDPEERRARGLLQQIHALEKAQSSKRKEKQSERKAERVSASRLFLAGSTLIGGCPRLAEGGSGEERGLPRRERKGSQERALQVP